MIKKVIPTILILLFCGLFDAAVADDSTMWWRGRKDEPEQWAVDTRWNNPDNWYVQDGKVRKPNDEDIVNLNGGTLDANVPYPGPNAVDPVIDSNNVGDNKAECWNVYVPYWQEVNSTACVLWVTGGVLEVGNDFILGSAYREEVEAVMDEGILEMSGGTITIGRKLSVGGTGGSYYHVGGRGTINMTGGTITCGTFYIPEGNCADPNGGGTVNLDGGTIYADSLVMHPNDPCGFMYITDGKLIIDGNQISLINGYAAEPNNWISAGEPNWVIQAIYYSVMNTNPEDMDTTRVIARNPELAWTPYPKDDTVRIPLGVTLEWLAGTKASDVNGHDVYFGSDEASVRDANVAVPLGVYKGRRSDTAYDTTPLSLVRGTTYYWRIDEVNNPAEIYKGRVWNFTLDDGRAYNPSPTGTIDTIEPDLRWFPGTDSNTHDVYLGTDFDEVNDANILSTGIFRGNYDVNTYDPGLLMVGTTYYWRIDEVNDITIKGHVWSFTTPEYIVAEDFDSYPDYPDLLAVWHDWAHGGVNSQLSVQEGSADANLVIDGNSMKFYYDNQSNPNKYAETYANTTGADSLGMDPNFKTYGAKALIVNFYGESTNTVAQPLYVVLEDAGANVGMATYDDGNAIQEERWHEWNIDLNEFDACGVNLRNVRKIYLGIGVRGNTAVGGGQGNVYFENISLAASRCLAGYGPQVDLSPDCFVDYDDLEVLFDGWLVKGYDVNAATSVPEPTFWYKFDETSGPNAYDSMHPEWWFAATYKQDPCDTNSYDINRIWDSDGGYDGNGCIVFGVDCNYAMRVPYACLYTMGDAEQITISAWVKGVVRAPNVWRTLFHGKKQGRLYPYWMIGQWRQDEDFILSLFANKDAPPGSQDDWVIWEGAEDVTEWTHFAFVKDLYADEMIMYVDGIPVAMTTTDPNQSMDGTSMDVFYIGGPADQELMDEWEPEGVDELNYDGSYLGYGSAVDDFRIYNQALSHPEILKLAGRESVHVNVVPLFLPGDPYVDDKIDLKDFAVVASYWLQVPLWP